MSQFKQMLQAAADTFNSDDEVDNVIVIISKKPREDGKVEQHTLTNIACPIGIQYGMLQEAAKQILAEKSRRLEIKES